MANIKASFGSGGANLTPGGASGSPALAEVLRDIADDIELLRSKYQATLTKLDSDSGVGDTDYVATNGVLATDIKTKKV